MSNFTVNTGPATVRSRYVPTTRHEIRCPHCEQWIEVQEMRVKRDEPIWLRSVCRSCGIFEGYMADGDAGQAVDA